MRSIKNARRLKNCAKHYTTDCSQRSEKVSGEVEKDSERQNADANQKDEGERHEINSQSQRSINAKELSTVGGLLHS